MIELTDKDVERLKNQPILESKVFKSKDGQWIVNKVTITDIKSINYLEKVMGS